jgi:3',5'-cyclic AMP phosphodiesterase CpdA
MRIGIVADTHLADRATAFRDNWEAARAYFAARAVDLIVHLGDISADGANLGSDLAEAAACFEGLSRVRFLPGNHDIGDNPIAPGAAPSDHPFDPARLADYRRLFGADRWTMRLPGWQMIGLNAQLFGTGTPDEEEQFAWLAAELAAEPAAALGLMLHKPLFRDGPADTEAHVRYVPATARGCSRCSRGTTCASCCPATRTSRAGSASTASSMSGRRRRRSASRTPCRRRSA